MPINREALLQAALELSEDDRVELANALLGTIADPLPGWSLHDPAFHQELDRRAADGDAGVPWDEVRREL